MSVLCGVDFGLVGDGLADDSAGLKAMRDVIRHGPDQAWTIDLDHGHYAYEDNTWWLFGDRDVTIQANYSRLECVSAAVWDRTAGLLPPMSPHEFWGDGRFVQAEAVIPAGTRFRSADASSHTIDLVTAVPDGLASGDVVLLAGQNQQIRDDAEGVPQAWGWPPNLAVYEYATVESATPESTTFRTRLRHAYDEHWQDWTMEQHGQTRHYGAPRLFKTRWPEWTLQRRLAVLNAVFAKGRNRTSTPLNFVGLLVELDRCRTEGNVSLHMHHCEAFLARDCDFGACEPDKINRLVRFERCVFRGAFSGMGAGVERLHLTDCDIMGGDTGRGLDHGPQHTTLENVLVHGRATVQRSPTVSVPAPVLLGGGLS